MHLACSLVLLRSLIVPRYHKAFGLHLQQPRAAKPALVSHATYGYLRLTLRTV